MREWFFNCERESVCLLVCMFEREGGLGRVCVKLREREREGEHTQNQYVGFVTDPKMSLLSIPPPNSHAPISDQKKTSLLSLSLTLTHFLSHSLIFSLWVEVIFSSHSQPFYFGLESLSLVVVQTKWGGLSAHQVTYQKGEWNEHFRGNQRKTEKWI